MSRTLRRKYRAIFLPQEGMEWHNEDTWAVSDTRPIFVVADGITQPVYEEIAEPSAAKSASELFCKKTIEYLEKRSLLSDVNIRSAIARANKSIGQYNRLHNINLSACGSVVAISRNRVFGARMADCGFVVIRRGKIFFKTPEYWSWLKKAGGEHGVADGRSDILPFVYSYECDFFAGDTLVLFTDGFENHFEAPKFTKVFQTAELSDIENKIMKLDDVLVEEDHEKYGHERTLLIVRL